MKLVFSVGFTFHCSQGWMCVCLCLRVSCQMWVIFMAYHLLQMWTVKLCWPENLQIWPQQNTHISAIKHLLLTLSLGVCVCDAGCDMLCLRSVLFFLPKCFMSCMPQEIQNAHERLSCNMTSWTSDVYLCIYLCVKMLEIVSNDQCSTKNEICQQEKIHVIPDIL